MRTIIIFMLVTFALLPYVKATAEPGNMTITPRVVSDGPRPIVDYEIHSYVDGLVVQDFLMTIDGDCWIPAQLPLKLNQGSIGKVRIIGCPIQPLHVITNLGSYDFYFNKL